MADEIKWIKTQCDLFNNRKIKQIEVMPEGDAILIIWIKLLCLAGMVNDNGYIYLTPEVPYTDELLANEFHKSVSLIRLALMTFEKFGMIEIIDNILHVSNWVKYQNVDGMEKIRIQNKLRKQKQRALAKQALLPESKDKDNMSRDSHVTVTQCHATDIDIDIELDIDINNEEENIYNNAREALISTFEAELKRPLTPIEMQFLFVLQNDYSNELITLALSEAVMNNARSFKYVERVLVNWKGAGITTVDEARQYIDKFNKRKSVSTTELNDMKREYSILANSPETLESASQLRMKYYDVTGRDIEDDMHD